MPEVMFGQSGGDHIAVRVLRRMHPDAADYWDGNWIASEVSITVRPWHGTYRADLRSEEFATFRQEVEEMYDGRRQVATFAPMEPWLELTLQLDSLGHVHLKGQAGPEGFGRIFRQVRLVFELRDFMDQTFLPPIIQQLKAIEGAFPVIGKPSD